MGQWMLKIDIIYLIFILDENGLTPLEMINLSITAVPFTKGTK